MIRLLLWNDLIWISTICLWIFISILCDIMVMLQFGGRGGILLSLTLKWMNQKILSVVISLIKGNCSLIPVERLWYVLELGNQQFGRFKEIYRTKANSSGLLLAIGKLFFLWYLMIVFTCCTFEGVMWGRSRTSCKGSPSIQLDAQWFKCWPTKLTVSAWFWLETEIFQL